MRRPTREARLLANLRPPPAFQEYGADLLGLETIQLMSLAERGLFATMRWKAWINDSVPRDPDQLARVLGLEPQQVRAALTERVLKFFAPGQDDPTRLVCTELAAQKNRYMEARGKMVLGGHRGGMSARHKEKIGSTTLEATQAARPQASGKASETRQEEQNRNEFSMVSATSSDEVAEYRRAFGEEIF